MEALQMSKNHSRDRPDWQRHRFQRVGDAWKPGSQDGDTAPQINRHLLEGAVRDPDPKNADKKRIRLKINADILDRELHAGRIDVAEYHAGREYQKLFEPAKGCSSVAIDGGSTRDAASVRDDAIVRGLDHASDRIQQQVIVQGILGLRSWGIVHQMLCESNLTKRRAWTFEEIAEAMYGSSQKHVVYAISSRFRDALTDLAKHWQRVEAS